jgi:hypothetical protein
MMALLTDSLHGFEVRVASVLVGSKKAICQGNILYVSPAMLALMENATSDELEHLCKHIEVLTLPNHDFKSLDMTIGV